MLNLDPLLTAILATIGADPACANVAGKVFYSRDTSGMPKPYARVQLLKGSAHTSYGKSKLNCAKIQLCVFALDLSQCLRLRAAVVNAVCDKAITLSDGTVVHAIERDNGLLTEPGSEPTQVVYHGFGEVEFYVDG